MAKTGGTKERLKSVQKELDEEVEKWKNASMSPDGFKHTPSSIFDLKCRVQALINVICKELNVNEDKLQLEYLTIFLHDLRLLREQFEPQIRQQRIATVTGRKDIAIPQPRIIGPDGKVL